MNWQVVVDWLNYVIDLLPDFGVLLQAFVTFISIFLV